MADLYVAADADNAGQQIGRAVLADDVVALHEVSSRIDAGQELIESWAQEHGGFKISGGGDEFTMSVPESAMEALEQLRADYQYTTHFTLTIGVGRSLSEAGKSLMVGKMRGKDMVVHYDEHVEQEINEAKQQGEKDERQKITDEYLTDPTPKPMQTKRGDAQSQVDQATSEQAQPAPDQAQAKLPSIQAIPEATSEPKDISQELDASLQNEKEMMDEMDTKNPKAAGDASNMAAHMDASLDNQKEMMGQMDGDDLTVEGESNDKPDDLGLAEEDAAAEPDLSQVMQGGLDQHAEGIQREKVINMISQALEGFKANKQILEKAKDQAPQLYDSCIAMLRAMIEMSKMLGLDQSAEQQPQDSQQEQPDQQDESQDEEQPMETDARTHGNPQASSAQGAPQNPKPSRQ